MSHEFGKRELTDIHLSEYNSHKWTIESSEEFDIWFIGLDENCKEAVLERTLLLQEYGPSLGRPYSDTLKGTSRKRNIKELRCQTDKHVLRVAYYFDKVRNAFLLIGGDKKGKDSKKFYSLLIRMAEAIIAQHERELEK
jgi:hypothetical protein